MRFKLPPFLPRSWGRQGLGRLPFGGCAPSASQRPQGVYGLPMGDPQGHGDPPRPHLLLRHVQEVGHGDPVVEDDQDGGPRAVVVGRPER